MDFNASVPFAMPVIRSAPDTVSASQWPSVTSWLNSNDRLLISIRNYLLSESPFASKLSMLCLERFEDE